MSRLALPPVSKAEGERLRSLASMARALGFSRDLFDVLERAVSEGCRVIDADSGSVSVLDRPAGLVRVLVNVGDLSPSEEPRPRNETYQLAGFPKLSQVVGDLRPWTCARTDERPDPQELALLEELEKGASLGAPVVVDGELWGELYFTRHLGRPAFDDTDLAYVETLAAILAAGVSRAVRESALTELAYQDPLTGLANRRLLDQTAAGMMPAQTGLVVVSLDVNDLKPVNDREGHAAGDRLLRAVAKALTEVADALPGSLAARTGGRRVLPGRAHLRRRTGRSRGQPLHGCGPSTAAPGGRQLWHRVDRVRRRIARDAVRRGGPRHVPRQAERPDRAALRRPAVLASTAANRRRLDATVKLP